jgi:hypothetical protein
MDLPYEIWLQIVEFLPSDFVRTLLTVNSSLFEIATDERYREVRVTTLDEQTLWLLFRLRCVLLTSTTSITHNCVWMQRSLDCIACSFSSSESVYPEQHPKFLVRASPKSWTWRFRKAVERVLRINPVRLWHTEEVVGDPATSKKIYLSFDVVVGGMVGAFPALSHVSEFAVEGFCQRPIYDMRLFYDAAWAGFGSNLRKLSLMKAMESFAEILHSPSLHFPQLQDVSITFIYTTIGMDIVRDVIRDVVAPFVNRHESTIRALSFSSKFPMGFSVLFSSFGLFPILQQNTLEFSFNDTVWSTDSVFTRFLRNHAKTLRRVKFSVKYLWYPRSIGFPSFRAWVIENAVDETIFRGLESLTIPTIEETDFDSMVLIIQNSIGNLSKLALTDRYLCSREVRTQVEMLSHHPLHGGLKSLRLNVFRLTPSFVCLVIEAFPRLRELCFLLSPAILTDRPATSTSDQHTYIVSYILTLPFLQFSPIMSRITGTFTITGSGIHITRNIILSAT